MPLVIISGKPYSGKSYFAKNLAQYLQENIQKYEFDQVCLVSDEDHYLELGLSRDEIYESSHLLEKRLRGNLKAAAEKVLVM